MTTRIDGNHGPLPVDDTRTEGDRAAEDTDFVNQAVRAANEAPDIRQDKVEQAKKALADGTLGADATKVADAIIDQMLEDNT